ncbi:MAG: acyl-CoA synthetase [Pseudomonadota bacterium]
MGKNYAGWADRDAIEGVATWEDRDLPVTMYQMLEDIKNRHGTRPAFSYQLTSGPTDPNETLTWNEVHARSCQAANLFRSLGVGEDDVVAYVLPNATETLDTLLGGMIAGIVNPINPLLEPGQISAILRETGAKVVVTLKPFPKTDLAQKVAAAVKDAPGVTHVIEVDLLRYLTGLKKFIVPLIRPKQPHTHHAKVLDFTKELAKHNKTLDFADSTGDRVAAYFHTGGTTGMPKVAQHKYSGMVYNGWLGHELLFDEKEVIICPLPLFHVFAVHVIMMAMIRSGAHVVFPTPQGYRGDGVFDNFWKLVERYQVTFMITVPTAISALMQRAVDADISSLKMAFSGSSPLPVELYKRFESACNVTITEGYGLTEATCLVSINPPDGEKKIGSIGIPFPYCDVQIRAVADGAVCGPDEIGEICVSNPGVFAGNTYTEADKNVDLYRDEKYLRTGDLGRLDADGYLWITGRAKDLIIRGGHNIDPAEIEEALAGHPDVAFAGAIGQPDAHSGELPCVYVELVEGGKATPDDLMAYCKEHVQERAAHPKYIELMDELPKTAVGKIFKPDLRRAAITRIYNAALKEAGLEVEVASVLEDKKRGLVAELRKTGEVSDAAVTTVLGEFTQPWQWKEAAQNAA